MVKCNFNTVVERDMDVLLLETVATDPEFARLLVDKTDLKGKDFEVIEVELSYSDIDGETDVTVIIDVEGTRYGFLIEDKIDAQAQDRQHARYIIRGEKGKSKSYQDYRVFIWCSEHYRVNNSEAREYEHFLSYEECKDYFDAKEDAISYVRSQQIEQAINKAKKHSETVINKNANVFFSKYQKYQKEHHSSLELVTSKKANGYWACYRTHFGPHVYLYHKINEGQVQLIFNHMADELEKLEYVACWARKHGIANVAAVQTGESAALRIYVPDMDMQKSFDNYVDDQVPKCFKAIEELIALANMALTISRLDYSNGNNK